jgi:hypothetical protein
MARPTPNFVILDGSFPDVGRLVTAMLKAREAVENRSWSHPQEPTTEEWWADVLADPRASALTVAIRGKRTRYARFEFFSVCRVGPGNCTPSLSQNRT